MTLPPASVVGATTPGSADALPSTEALAEREDGPAVDLPLGTRVGRYVVLQRLGQGGMGVVYAGHDPDLDRRVAIKVLRGRFGEADRRERILREGKAMARVSHPNVVQVFDVGSHEGNVFIAMELVDGVTLDVWLRERRPPYARIVDVFVEAGAALEAAHKAGLVHRDFKPSNVLIDQRGRAHVADFGVARLDRLAHGSELSTVSEDAAGTASGGDTAEEVERRRGPDRTRLAGTPAYMAPEQLEGISNELSDQFSFFVSLYQALFGRLPYPASGAGYLTRERFARPPSPGRSRVPSRVVEVVLRGLRVDPRERYPSIAAAVADLAAAPGRFRRRLFVATASLAAAGLLAGTYALASARSPCPSPLPAWQEVWNGARAAELAARFATTGRPYAQAMGERVAKALDQRGARWVELRIDACEATRVRGEQSAELLDRRMECLDQRLAETRALVQVLTTDVDPALVDHALEAALGLTPLDACADRAALLSAYPPPSAPDARRAMGALRPRIDHAAALARAGRYPSARAELDALTKDVAALDHAPLSAEVLLLRGVAEQHVGELPAAQGTLEQAARAAAVARDETTLASTWIQLMWLVGYERERHAEALALRPVIEAELARLGDPKALRARYLHTAGQVLYRQGKLDEAQTTEELALRLRDESGQGATHDSVLLTLGNLASERGDFARARSYYERALAEVEGALGPDHLDTASARLNLGNVARDQHRYDEALAFYASARRVLAATLGDESPELAAVENNTAAVLVSERRWADAVPHYEAAVRLWSRLGQDHPRLGYPLVGLGACLTALGAPDKALPILDRALALWHQKLGPEHPRLVDVYKEVATTRLALGDATKADIALERALAIATPASLDPETVGELHFLQAKAARARRDEAAAERAARAALTSFARAEGDTASERQEIERWLARGPSRVAASR